jgi:hypothetical protein
MRISETALSRIGKLIRLLGSDKPGEAIGAVHAIRRTLAGAGLDLHDLARIIESNGGDLKAVSRMASDSLDWQRLAVRLLREHGDELSEKEAAFVDTMSVWDDMPSPKQQKWLLDIAARIARAA